VEAASRTRLIQLGVLAVILVGLVQFVLVPSIWPSSPTPAPGSRNVARNRQGARPAGTPAAGAVTATAPEGAPQVRLDALARGAGVAPPDGSHRNPFRMGAAPPPPAPTPAAGTMAAATPRVVAPPPVSIGPVTPPPPPPPPPIPYRFIGVVSGAPGVGRIAVLTDGRTVVHGRVNDIVEGRYRIVQIGEESIQIEHADGRGRQTLRLLGQ
jgi:hypothetical protein